MMRFNGVEFFDCPRCGCTLRRHVPGPRAWLTRLLYRVIAWVT